METFKIQRTPDTNAFISFLESDVLKTPVLSIYQFNKGASSRNYLVETGEGKKLVKIAFKHKKEAIERLAKIIHLLSQNKHLITARIIPMNNQLFFKYKKYYGFVLEYINGKALPSYEMGDRHFQQVLHGYAFFKKMKWDDTSVLMPAYDFEKMCSTCLNNCLLQLKKYKNTSEIKTKILNGFLNRVYQHLQDIQKTPLQMKPEKTTLIHGDFHNNNLLFNKEKLMSFLDFEDVGLGYITEDLMRFILCLTERLPVFVHRDSYFLEWIDLSNKRFLLTQEDWMIGLNSFTLQKIQKVLIQIKNKSSFFKIKKILILLFFLKRYRHIQKLIQQSTC